MSERWTASSCVGTATVLVRWCCCPPRSFQHENTAESDCCWCVSEDDNAQVASAQTGGGPPPDDHLLAHSTQMGVLLSLEPFNDLMRGHLFSPPLFMPAQPFVVLSAGPQFLISCFSREPAGVRPSIWQPKPFYLTPCLLLTLSERSGVTVQGAALRARLFEVTWDVPPVSWCYRHLCFAFLLL